MGTRPKLVQIESSNKSVYPHLQKEMESIGEDIELLYDQTESIAKRVTDNSLKKTAVFYVSRIRQPNHAVSLFVPLKGRIVNMYVNMGRVSEEDLDIKLVDVFDNVIGNMAIEKGNTFTEGILSHDIDYEKLKIVVNGEMLLSDVSVSVDIVPIGTLEEEVPRDEN